MLHRCSLGRIALHEARRPYLLVFSKRSVVRFVGLKTMAQNNSRVTGDTELERKLGIYRFDLCTSYLGPGSREGRGDLQ